MSTQWAVSQGGWSLVGGQWMPILKMRGTVVWTCQMVLTVTLEHGQSDTQVEKKCEYCRKTLETDWFASMIMFPRILGWHEHFRAWMPDMFIHFQILSFVSQSKTVLTSHSPPILSEMRCTLKAGKAFSVCSQQVLFQQVFWTAGILLQSHMAENGWISQQRTTDQKISEVVDLNRKFIWVVVSNIFYFHPYLGKWSNLTNMFSTGLKPPTSYGL